MNPQDLEALKARVDEAEEGSRELDALIAKAIEWMPVDARPAFWEKP